MIDQQLYMTKQQAELVLSYKQTRMAVTYKRTDAPLTVEIHHLRDVKTDEHLVTWLNELSDTPLTGEITVDWRHGKAGYMDLMYNASRQLIALYEPLMASVMMTISQDGVIMSEDVSLAVALDDSGQLTALHLFQALDIPTFNQALAIISQHYEEMKQQWQTNEEDSTMEEKTIIIATNNIGKAKEFARLFEPKGYQVKTLRDFPDLPEVEETGQTFEENARLKAETIATLLNRPVLADDSGLCVDALGGQPGIYSARYAEDHNDAANNAKLLSELADVAPLDRTAHFHCTLVLAAPQKESLVVEGEVEGLIAGIPRGENGFGYDPIFYLPEFDKTMAELTPEQKNQFSHRAVATKKLSQEWEAWLNE